MTPAIEHDSGSSANAPVASNVRAIANAAANRLLHDLAKSIDAGTPLTIEEVVERIRAIPPNPANIRPAEPGLDEVLRRKDESGEPFDEVAWNREWMAIEAELKRLSG